MLEGNAHTVNILQWQLDGYLVGETVIRDQLGNLIDEIQLIQRFLKKHTAKNLVDQIQIALKPSSPLEELFTEYIQDHLKVELTFIDEEEISKQLNESWITKSEKVKTNFNYYLEAHKGVGKYAEFKDRLPLLARILELTEDQINCANMLDLEILMIRTKYLSIQASKPRIEQAYISDKIRQQYYDTEKDRWGSEIIAKMLEEMNILMLRRL